MVYQSIRIVPIAGYMGRKLFAQLVVVLGIFGVWQLGQGGYIFAKAQLAQWLIADAWDTSLVSQEAVKPWSWADTWPVAQLSINGEQIYVLQGASLRVLAFGPGFLNQSATPGNAGNTLILGHRDTHFAVLESVQIGDVIPLVHHGGTDNYRVTDIEVVHKDQLAVWRGDDQRLLTLITCYPFDGVTSDTPWRYVVVSQAI